MSPYETQLSKDLNKKTYLFFSTKKRHIFLTETEAPQNFEIVFKSYGRARIMFSKNLPIRGENEERGGEGGRKELHPFYPIFIHCTLMYVPFLLHFSVPVTPLVTTDIKSKYISYIFILKKYLYNNTFKI